MDGSSRQASRGAVRWELARARGQSNQLESLFLFSSSEPAATAAATASCFSVCLSLARFALEVDSGGGSWLGPNDDGAPSQAGSGTPHNDSETSDSRGKATTRHGLGLSPIATPSWPLPSQACPPSPRRAPLRCLDPLACRLPGQKEQEVNSLQSTVTLQHNYLHAKSGWEISYDPKYPKDYILNLGHPWIFRNFVRNEH